MPNHVTNRLVLTGPKTEIKKLIKKYTTVHPRHINKAYDDSIICREELTGEFMGWYYEVDDKFQYAGNKEKIDGLPKGISFEYNEEYSQFPDFNKIIPKPKSLDIDSNSWLMPLDNQFSGHIKFKEHLDELKEYCEENPFGAKETVDNFITGVKNYIKYGSATWYSWSVKNWGTKWNSYSCKKEDENIFTFETAWDGVPSLIEMMGLEFPNVDIKYEWSNEDTGRGCGRIIYYDGMVDNHEIKDGSIEAYELAFKLTPHNKEYYELVDGEYKYVEEE